jgi:hypothetical protein
MKKIATWSPLDLSDPGRFEGPVVILHVPVEQSRKTWVGRCIELGTMSVGKTEAEARKNLIALVTLQLNTLEATGQRERVFRERDIVVHDEIPEGLSPSVSSQRDETQLFEAQPAAA